LAKGEEMIVVDENRCTGCRSCELACSFQQKRSFHYNFSLIRIYRNKEREGFFTPRVCRHCEAMACAQVCPTLAIHRDETGITSIDKQKCSACGLCINSCPWLAPLLDPEENQAKICDLCQGDPLCVKFCNPGALAIK